VTWPTVKLGDVCITTSGGTPKRGVGEYYGGEIAWVKSGELHCDLVTITEETLTSEGINNSSAKLMPKGTVLLAMYGATIGAVSVLGIEAATNQAICCLKPNVQKLYPKFLVHFLKASKDKLINYAVGGAQPNINQDIIRNLQIQLPPLAEQQRIAAILDKAEEINRKREQAIVKLDELAQSTFVDMFGDVKSNSKNWRLNGVANLVRNEDALRKPVKLMDRAEMQGQFDYYGASGVIDKIDQYIYEGDRLLIGEDGANLVARSSPIAFIAKGKYWVNNHAHVLAETDALSIKYLEYFFNNIDLKPYVTGSAQPKLTRAALDRIQVPVPPKNLQTTFQEFIHKIETLKKNFVNGANHCLAMKNALQNQAFTTGFRA
jgi:restriction endonuclease S subunit